MFFNELELLHLRLLEYYNFIDYFVIVESIKSHTGKLKPLYYEENKNRFKDFQSFYDIESTQYESCSFRGCIYSV